MSTVAERFIAYLTEARVNDRVAAEVGAAVTAAVDVLAHPTVGDNDLQQEMCLLAAQITDEVTDAVKNGDRDGNGEVSGLNALAASLLACMALGYVFREKEYTEALMEVHRG